MSSAEMPASLARVSGVEGHPDAPQARRMGGASLAAMRDPPGRPSREVVLALGRSLSFLLGLLGAAFKAPHRPYVGRHARVACERLHCFLQRRRDAHVDGRTGVT